jgi:spore maturation protein CgeB
MRILYVAMRYDYGERERGLSFEQHNFFEALRLEGHELIPFDYMTLLDELGRGAMNRRLFELARSEEPQIMFTVLFRDELDPRVVRRISSDLPTVTLNWFCDDHWRFEAFSARWAPCFNWVVTTASSALPKYARIGYGNVIKSQWGCNDHDYRPLGLPLTHDVSFVGQPYGERRSTIADLRAAGINVLTRGYGWEEGRVSQMEMIRIFNQSRINLNLAGASRSPLPPPERAPRLLRPAARLVRRMPFAAEAAAIGRRLQPGLARAARANEPSAASPGFVPEQIKGRNFEVPGCGGFLLTEPADDLERYYEPGREIAVFRGRDELIEQVRHYLANERERRLIAEAGYARTAREHTYARRFEQIFETMGLPGHEPPRAPVPD